MPQTVYTDNFNQTATYWAPGASDGFGGSAFAAPVSFACRWQDKQVMFRDAQAREVMSDAIVYVAQVVENGGRLILGINTSATPPTEAKEIRQFGSSPALDNARILHKAIL